MCFLVETLCTKLLFMAFEFRKPALFLQSTSSIKHGSILTYAATAALIVYALRLSYCHIVKAFYCFYSFGTWIIRAVYVSVGKFTARARFHVLMCAQVLVLKFIAWPADQIGEGCFDRDSKSQLKCHDKVFDRLWSELCRT